MDLGGCSPCLMVSDFEALLYEKNFDAEDLALDAKDWRADPTTSGSSRLLAGAGGGGGGMGGGALVATGGGLDANCEGGGTGDTEVLGGLGAGAGDPAISLLGLGATPEKSHLFKLLLSLSVF